MVGTVIGAFCNISMLGYLEPVGCILACVQLTWATGRAQKPWTGQKSHITPKGSMLKNGCLECRRDSTTKVINAACATAVWSELLVQGYNSPMKKDLMQLSLYSFPS